MIISIPAAIALLTMIAGAFHTRMTPEELADINESD